MNITMKSSIPGARLEEAIEFLKKQKLHYDQQPMLPASYKRRHEDVTMLLLHFEQVLEGCLICSDCKNPDCPGCI